jgi:hypothetical protein
MDTPFHNMRNVAPAKIGAADNLMLAPLAGAHNAQAAPLEQLDIRQIAVIVTLQQPPRARQMSGKRSDRELGRFRSADRGGTM